MSDTVTLALAHPLSPDQARRLNAKDVKEYKVGDKITVPLDNAHAIINAGFADGVEPGNADQIQAALNDGAAKKTKSA